MRIIAGTARGATIAAPKGLATRPMTERVRAAIFNILGQEVVGATVLDLFAGSGSLGLEALSRGAARAVFVEGRPAAAQVLRRNIQSLRFTDRCRVMVADALRLPAGALPEPFDLVFIDPPYRLGERLDRESEIAVLVRNLFAGQVLKQTVGAVLRTPRRAGKAEDRGSGLWLPERVHAADVRVYGADRVWFLRRQDHPA